MVLTRKATAAPEDLPPTIELLQRVLVRSLQKSPSSKEIPAAALKALEREFKVRTYAAREIVFFEGQTQDAFLLMLRGVATLTYLDSRHRRVLFAVIGPGEVCVHADALPEPLRGRLRCDAVRDCVIASLDYKRFVELLFGVPFGRFAAGVSFIFGARDDRLARAVLARGKTLRERLLEVIGDLCARFGISNDRGTILDLPLTHEDLADLVGASRPKVTREVRLLEKEGALAREGRRLVFASAPRL
jgi:CRP/FNR family transcriptional regulator, cyclic AMP receptor protein